MTASLPPLVAALARSEDIIGAPPDWRALNGDQVRFLYETYRKVLPSLGSVPELAACASADSSAIQVFLADHGFQDVPLRPFGANEFGVASVLDATFQWATAGDPAKIRADGRQYAAADVEWCAEVLYSANLRVPVAAVQAMNGGTVYMAPWAEWEGTALDLHGLGADLIDYLGPSPKRFDGVRYPLAALQDAPDLGWLLGMNDGGFQVKEAVQRTRLRLNRFGLRAESAAAATLEVIGFSKLLVIDVPFLVVVCHPALGLPLLVAHVTQEAWKDPGDLSTSF